MLYLQKMSASQTSLRSGDGPRPKSMSRPKQWSEEVEEAYRFQLAGYRDAMEYQAFMGLEVRMPNSFVS